MYNREISLWEFRERVKDGGFGDNAITGLWNWLAEFLLGYRRSAFEVADCTLPLDKLLGLTPEGIRRYEGVGPARFAVYRWFYRSLLVNAQPLEKDWRKLTLENFHHFAKNSAKKHVITSIWHNFLITKGIPGGVEPTIRQLEAYCEEMKEKGKASTVSYLLLTRWLEWLQQ